MKLCPQCDFIYEDEQVVCDMDGRELVHKLGSESRFKLVIPITPGVAPKTPPTRSRRSNGFVVAVVAVVILATLAVLAYFARARRANAGLASGKTVEYAQQSDPAVATPIQTTNSPAQSTTTQNDVASANGSPEEVQTTSKTALAHARLTAGPVAATASSDHGLVIVRLTNGSSIKADEAWEKPEGVWYRQKGLVTFLKRSQVRSIERLPRAVSPNDAVAGSNTVASGSGGNGNTRATRARSQQLAQVQPAPPKKQTGVTSFLKKTGSFIKKPFHF